MGQRARSSRLTKSAARALGGSVLWWLCAACPAPREAPEPREAPTCEQLEDCNCGADCGALNACVHGFCEQGRSLLLPCRPGQQPREESCEVP